jgi:hypothetical protein
MTTTTKVISSSEVAYLLRKYLGPGRAWDDVLADMRRDRTHVCNFVLEPSCRLKDERAWRPYYTATDVIEFIRNVRAACPTTGKDIRPIVRDALTDPTDRRPWRLRRLTAAAPTRP